MRRRVALLSTLALAAGVAVPLALAGNGADPAIYLVGGGVRSINPTHAMLANHDFYLGGYGFSSGKAANTVEIPGVADALGNRYATGILGDGKYGAEGDGAHTRAFLVSDRAHTIVLAQIETQGYFNAYKQGPFGINEIRQDAAARIADLVQQSHGSGRVPPAPTAEQIVVDSNHSHGGPDTAGVWGGVPTSYLKLVHDRTVGAIVDAWKAAQPATLSYGVAKAGVDGEGDLYPPEEGNDAANPDYLLTNQFSYDPANKTMDNEVRVLQAHDSRTGKLLDTYVNFSAHPTVLGSDNHKVTADYVGRLNVQLEREFGGFAMDQVGTLGRTQPTDRDCANPAVSKKDADAQNLCRLDEYAHRVVRKVAMAVDNAKPLTGDPQVAMNSYLLNDPTTSPILAGIVYGGEAIGAPAARAANAPWYTGTVLGTSVFSGRIGDILISGGPGEMYPQIVQKVRDTVLADNPQGIKGFMNIGTAGDFLGYIIAPLEAYPEPVKRSMLDGDNMPSPIDNDNYFFNISHTFGERLTCDLLRGAGDVLAHDKSRYWSTYDRCPAFVNDYQLAPGTDTTFPQQPDLSAVLTHL